jgi:F420-dependent oxidoreductase-like protein
MEIRVPTPCLVVLVGASGSGKSTWATENSGPGEVVSSDALREQVGESAHDQRASADAFALLDATSLDDNGRAKYREFARAAAVPCVAIAFPTDAATCRRRNRARVTPVPAAVLTKQLKDFDRVLPLLQNEGFDSVYAEPAAMRRMPSAGTGLRFGLQLPRHGWPGGTAETAGHLREAARAAEDAGFVSLWVMDHFIQIPQAGREWEDILESYTTLGFLAGVTSRIRLGTLVTGVTYRNVALLGKIIATLDVVSGGRAIAGLGAAWYEREHVAYGFEFPPLRERYALLEDALELLPLMWGKGAPAYKGRCIEVPEAMCYPRPLQEHIPILIGGSGEKKTLRLVAKYADACNLFGDAKTVARKIAVLHEHCAAEGRDPKAIEITHLGTLSTSADPIPRYAEYAAAGVQTAIVNLPGEPTAADIAALGTLVSAFDK